MNKEQMIALCQHNKTIKTGERIVCICGVNFQKRSHQQTFCSPKCKNNYWDTIDPERAKRKDEAKQGRFKRE